MSKFNEPSRASKGTSAYSGSKIASPANTPDEQQKTLGGMPPEKTVKQINDANDPSKRGPAPGAVHGV